MTVEKNPCWVAGRVRVLEPISAPRGLWLLLLLLLRSYRMSLLSSFISETIGIFINHCLVYDCSCLNMVSIYSQRVGILNVGQKIEEQAEFEKIYKNGIK